MKTIWKLWPTSKYSHHRISLYRMLDSSKDRTAEQYCNGPNILRSSEEDFESFLFGSSSILAAIHAHQIFNLLRVVYTWFFFCIFYIHPLWNWGVCRCFSPYVNHALNCGTSALLASNKMYFFIYQTCFWDQ